MKYFENFKCVGKKKTSYKFGLKRALRSKLGLKMPKTDIKIEEDPFLRLGKCPESEWIPTVAL